MFISYFTFFLLSMWLNEVLQYQVQKQFPFLWPFMGLNIWLFSELKKYFQDLNSKV